MATVCVCSDTSCLDVTRCHDGLSLETSSLKEEEEEEVVLRCTAVTITIVLC